MLKYLFVFSSFESLILFIIVTQLYGTIVSTPPFHHHGKEIDNNAPYDKYLQKE